MRHKFLLIFVGLAIIPLLLFSMLLCWQSFQVLLEEAIYLHAEQAIWAAQEVSNLSDVIEREFFRLVHLTNLMQMDVSEQKHIISKLRAYKDERYRDIFNEISLVDAVGRELVRVSRDKVYTEADLRDFSVDAIFESVRSSGNAYYSPVFFRGDTEEPLIVIGVPIRDVRTLTLDGVVLAEIRLRFVWEFIVEMKVGKSGTVSILDGAGRVLGCHDDSLVLKGLRFASPEVIGIVKNHYGRNVIQVSRKSYFANRVFWVVIQRPLIELILLLSRSLISILVFLIVMLGVAFFLWKFFAIKFISPLEELANVSHAIRQGDLTQRADAEFDDEIGFLASSFNQMADSLVSTIDSLHLRVSERERAETALADKSERLRRAMDQFSTVMDSLDSAIYVIDVETHEVLFINKYAANIWGDIVGQICWKSLQKGFAGPCPFCDMERLLTKYRKGEGVDVRTVQSTFNGEWYEYRDRVITWTDNRLVRVEIAFNVSLRKKMEEAQDQLISELEAKNAELEHFTYTVSHDLKSPLVTVKGFVGLLRDEDLPSGNLEHIHDDMDHIVNAVDKMQELLNDLLHLSKIGRIANKPVLVVFQDVVDEAIEFVQGCISDRNVKIEIVTELPPVFGDPLRLREVMQNLIENAVKYMGDTLEPRIRIGVRYDEARGESVCFVQDNGIGIEERYVTSIFDLFEQLDPRGGGTGIGLAIVKKIVQGYDGRVWVESKGLGFGSTFFFSLPG